MNLELYLPPLAALPALEEQRRRKLFWESYLLDRHTSTILGRPFAIADEDIEVRLPVNLSDERIYVMALGCLDTTEVSASGNGPMSVFLAFIRLRRITSKIHYAFFEDADKAKLVVSDATPSHISALAGLFATHSELSGQLDQWRGSVPEFDTPNTFYKKPEWYDFLLEKEKLLLVRGAMRALPSREKLPPKYLQQSCCECTSKMIELYGSLFWAKEINCTRHYFQVLFTAGLLLAYFSPGGLGDADRGQHMFSDGGAKRTLEHCGDLLKALGHEIHDAKPYAAIFEVICGTICLDWRSSGNPYAQMQSGGHDMTLTVDQEYNDSIASIYAEMMQMSSNEISTSQTLQPLDDADLMDWSYSPGHLFADMEAYVNQFATGDFDLDPSLHLPSWNPLAPSSVPDQAPF